MNRPVLVTGASGFVGRRLIDALRASGRDVRAAYRSQRAVTPDVHSVQVGGLGPDTDWTEALQGVDTVVHLAARVHVMNDTVLDPLAEFRRVNVEGTLTLARQAVASGARRFVFVSSIKVNGEATLPGKPFTADDTPAPQDAYGISKYEAETGLLALSATTGMEVVIIRPVLVYGSGVGANFLSMMRWLKKGVPLPLGAIRNKRSMVALDNLVDLIAVCLDHPAASGQVFLASDGEDLSTPDLLRRTARALGKRALLVPVPAIFLKIAAGLFGKGDVAQRLCGSLQVDINKNKALLGWTPPVSVDAGLVMAVRHMLDRSD